MNAFLTGSQEFGYNKPDSDIDLVILTDSETKEKIIQLSDTGKMPIKFGKLNLIVATTPEEYSFWLLAKRWCEIGQVKSKKESKCFHDEIRDQFGFKDYDHESEGKEKNDNQT
jgi:predicted nucleotidyltransferase